VEGPGLPVPEDEVRFWPPGVRVEAGDGLDLRCPSCEVRWRVLAELAGAKLRCVCGTWIGVPRLPSSGPLSAPISRPGPGEIPIDGTSIRLDAALEEGALEDAREDDRRKWLREVILDLTFVLGPFFLVPFLLYRLLPPGREYLATFLGQPLIGILVFLACLRRPEYSFAPLRRFRWGFVSEVAVATLIALGLAVLIQGLVGFLDEDLRLKEPILETSRRIGPWLAYLSFAAFPAFFEEIAFRGLLLGRIAALYGRSHGIWITAVAFMVAHGLTPVLPVILLIGFYLGHLRFRSKSLIPGMIFHALYNGLHLLQAF